MATAKIRVGLALMRPIPDKADAFVHVIVSNSDTVRADARLTDIDIELMLMAAQIASGSYRTPNARMRPAMPISTEIIEIIY